MFIIRISSAKKKNWNFWEALNATSPTNANAGDKQRLEMNTFFFIIHRGDFFRRTQTQRINLYEIFHIRHQFDIDIIVSSAEEKSELKFDVIVHCWFERFSLSKIFFLESNCLKINKNYVENLSLGKKSSDESGHCRRFFVRSFLFFPQWRRNKEKIWKPTKCRCTTSK